LKESVVTLCAIRRLYPVLLISLLALAACHPFRKTRYEGQSNPEIMYQQAHRALNSQSYDEAIKIYEALESRFPFSDSAHQAQLDVIYAYFKSRQTESAVDAADTFIRENPTHPRADYAHYMKGLNYFERQANVVERFFKADLTARPPTDTRQSFDAFATLIQRYPASPYAADARQRMIFLRNRLANFDLHVAEYYMRRGAYVAAINRAKFCVENYDGAPALQPAMLVLIDGYRALKMADLAADAERVYQTNFPADKDATAPRKKHWWNPFSRG
jgi:outer membrane protein assembly factor BamD